MADDWFDTAAELGTFLTEREELRVQRGNGKTAKAQLKAQGEQLKLDQRGLQLQESQNRMIGEQLDLMRRQERQAEDDRLLQGAAAAVEEGRMTRDQAVDFIETARLNKRLLVPRRTSRIYPGPKGRAFLGLGGRGSGWYRDPLKMNRTRYWDGSQWTLHTMPGREANKLRWAAVKAKRNRKPQLPFAPEDIFPTS